MNKLIMVALGGAVGAVARYWLGGWISSRVQTQFPLGTFVVNITGSFIIGFFLTLVSERVILPANWRLLVAVGFVGAYTTFSTFEYETLRLIEEGNLLAAALNITLSVSLGFIAVWLGVAAGRNFYLPTVLASGLTAVIAGLGRTGTKSEGKTGDQS